MATVNDWRGTKTVVESLEHLCLTQNLADVEFVFQSKHVKLSAHKFVLGMRSAVFEAMFYGPMGSSDTEIMIDDCDPDSFRVFLKYLYTDAACLNGSVVSSCLYLAEKYAVHRLVDDCCSFLHTYISHDNVCTIYEQATFYDRLSLQKDCLKYMIDHDREVFQSNDFLNISKKTLKTYLEQNELSANELAIFKAALSWAKHQCTKDHVDETFENIRKCLGDVLYCVRFPLMSIETFAKEISPSGLLTKDDEIQLYKYIATANSSGNIQTDLDKKFTTEPRTGRHVEVFFEKKQQKAHVRYHPTNTGSIVLAVETPGSLKIHSIKGNIFDQIDQIHIRWFDSLENVGARPNPLKEKQLDKDSWQLKENELEFAEDIAVDNNACQITMELLPNHLIADTGKFTQSHSVNDSEVQITYSNYRSGYLEAIVFSK